MKKPIELDLTEFIGLQLQAVEPQRLLFDQAVIDIWCPWRAYDSLIFINASVLTDPNLVEKAQHIVQKALIGRTIQHLTIFEQPCDVCIEFDQGITIELFPDHPVYESWRIQHTCRLPPACDHGIVEKSVS